MVICMAVNPSNEDEFVVGDVLGVVRRGKRTPHRALPHVRTQHPGDCHTQHDDDLIHQ